MPYTLTRLLYAKDEVIYSLLNELLLQENLEACFFWCGELFYSEFDHLYNIIWKIYFDFYAEFNPHLERYIQKKQILWEKEKNIKHVLLILYNMFHLKSSSTTFLLRLYVEQAHENITLYRKSNHKKWEWLHQYPTHYHSLLKALCKNHLMNAAVYLNQLMVYNHANDIYTTIIKYYREHVPLVHQNIIDAKWKNRGWYNDFHGLLSLIVHLQTPIDNISHPLVFKIPKMKDIQYIEDLNNEILKRHAAGNAIYRILQDFRLFKINNMIGVFLLKRNSLRDYKDEMNHYWEYYTNGCPLWKKRFEKCNATFDHKTLLETTLVKSYPRFDENYNLEYDEQSLSVKSMSTCFIKNISLENWHRKIFKIAPKIFIAGKIVY
tara:strand:+ start:53 stop:1186 length:1134 start_codon:yes stop_codon:yes gene_type:complete